MQRRRHTDHTPKVIGIMVCVVIGIAVVPKLLAPSEGAKLEIAREAIDAWAKKSSGGAGGKSESVRHVWSGMRAGNLVDVYRAKIVGGNSVWGPSEMDFRIRFEGRTATIEDSWLTARELNRMQDIVDHYR